MAGIKKNEDGYEVHMKTLIADDHALVLAGLKLVLQKIDSDVDVLESADLPSAIELAAELVADGVELDLAILDLRMPGMNGSAGIETFCTRFSDTPVIVLSGNYRRQNVLECFRRGASGFIPKALGTKATMNAIQLVLDGGKYLPADILPKRLEDNGSQNTDPTLNAHNPLGRLTERERDVLAELVKGLPNKTIAKYLEIQEVTVKLHLWQIYKKLDVENRVQAVKIALAFG